MQPKEKDLTLLTLGEVLFHARISKRVLHAWVRRYGLTPHEKTASSRRLYTQEQAERFRLLKLCTDAGHRIGTLVNLPLEQLTELLEKAAVNAALGPAWDMLDGLELEQLEGWLSLQASQQDVKPFILNTVFPLMQAVGTRWAERRLSIADEHFVTAFVKRLLLDMFGRQPAAPASAPRLIATTPEGEAHELGALCAAILGREAGWNAIYLGPNLPAAEIARMAVRYGVRCICLSVAHLPHRRLVASLQTLQAAIPEDATILVGGAASGSLPSNERCRVVSDLERLHFYLEQNAR